MANRSSFKKVGRGMLLGVAVGALPLAGCTELMPPGKEIWVTADEKHYYDQAKESGDPALVSRFIKKFPDSELIRLLLTSLPPSDLQRVSPSAVAAIDPAVIETLPPSVRRQLNLVAPVVYAPRESDSY